MSAETVESNPESDAVEEKSSVADKSTTLFEAARVSFEEGDYSASTKSLEDIPETLRNDEIKELLTRSKQLRSSENLFKTANRAFDAKDYDLTILTINKIPEADRSDQCKDLLKNARIVPMVKLGRRKLNNFRYDEVVELFQSVPKEDRSNELVELLQTAYTCKRRIEELNGEIESALKEADEHCSAEKYGEVVTLLEELLALLPGNDEVEDQLHEISNVKARFVERDRLYNEARDAFQDKKFRLCEELLEEIPERIRKGDALDLLEEAINCRERCKVLTDDIVTAIEESNYSNLEILFSELVELLHDSYSKVAKLLEEDDLYRTIFDMAKLSSENERVCEVLHGFLDSLDTTSVIEFLKSTEGSFSEYLTGDCKILIPKIHAVFEELPEYSPQRNRVALKAIGSIPKHFGEIQPRWEQWNRFWGLLGQILDCGTKEWSIKEQWFESEKSKTLDTISQQLAELSEQLLNVKDRDSWTLLKNLTGIDLKFKFKPQTRAFHKIERYLQTKKWNRSPLVPLTKKRIIRGTLLAIGVTALASIVQVLMTFVFGMGGFLGFGMVIFLAGLWTAFYIALHKIM